MAPALELLRRSLHAAGKIDVFTSLPTIVVAPRARNPGWVRHGQWTAADAAIAVFSSIGLRGERTRVGIRGYPELLRELSQPAPWVEVEPEDVAGEVTEQRRYELRPLLEWVLNTPEDDLLATCEEMHRKREAWLQHSELFTSHPADASPEQSAEVARVAEFMRKARLDAMRQRIEVGRALGAATFGALFDALFPLDEYSVCAGVPDILVWHPSDPDLWFLSEVKAPGDTLRPGQKAWLRENWHYLQGHFILTLLE
jgi:hypothetical protein